MRHPLQSPPIPSIWRDFGLAEIDEPPMKKQKQPARGLTVALIVFRILSQRKLN